MSKWAVISRRFYRNSLWVAKKDYKPFVDASVAFAEVISTLVSSGGFIELELVASLVSRYNISFRL